MPAVRGWLPFGCCSWLADVQGSLSGPSELLADERGWLASCCALLAALRVWLLCVAGCYSLLL
jgi:hypothetical protein